uniref:Uncharacterized protein n=1 Tax=Knipowitschia caucasica TaxID=637954 RepID=A0AAV2M3K5_KNICA
MPAIWLPVIGCPACPQRACPPPSRMLPCCACSFATLLPSSLACLWLCLPVCALCPAPLLTPACSAFLLPFLDFLLTPLLPHPLIPLLVPPPPLSAPAPSASCAASLPLCLLAICCPWAVFRALCPPPVALPPPPLLLSLSPHHSWPLLLFRSCSPLSFSPHDPSSPLLSQDTLHKARSCTTYRNVTRSSPCLPRVTPPSLPHASASSLLSHDLGLHHSSILHLVLPFFALLLFATTPRAILLHSSLPPCSSSAAFLPCPSVPPSSLLLSGMLSAAPSFSPSSPLFAPVPFVLLYLLVASALSSLATPWLSSPPCALLWTLSVPSLLLLWPPLALPLLPHPSCALLTPSTPSPLLCPATSPASAPCRFVLSPSGLVALFICSVLLLLPPPPCSPSPPPFSAPCLSASLPATLLLAAPACYLPLPCLPGLPYLCPPLPPPSSAVHPSLPCPPALACCAPRCPFCF